jgi:hypothetical protein
MHSSLQVVFLGNAMIVKKQLPLPNRHLEIAMLRICSIGRALDE